MLGKINYATNYVYKSVVQWRILLSAIGIKHRINGRWLINDFCLHKT